MVNENEGVHGKLILYLRIFQLVSLKLPPFTKQQFLHATPSPDIFSENGFCVILRGHQKRKNKSKVSVNERCVLKSQMKMAVLHARLERALRKSKVQHTENKRHHTTSTTLLSGQNPQLCGIKLPSHG